jgi:hypothetical protein
MPKNPVGDNNSLATNPHISYISERHEAFLTVPQGFRLPGRFGDEEVVVSVIRLGDAFRRQRA